MRLAMLTLIFLSFPLFFGLLANAPKRRPLALGFIAFTLFLSGDIRVEAFLYGWTTWQGTVRGFAVSPADTLALALLMTRREVGFRLPFWPWFAAYGITVLLSVFAASVPLASFFFVWQYTRVLLLFTVVGLEAGNPASRNALLGGLCFGLLAQLPFVIQQKLAGVVQASGAMAHQNILGLATEAALFPLLAALLAGDRRILVKIGVLAALCIIALGGSRGTLGFAAFGIVTLLILSLTRGITMAKRRVLGFAFIAALITAPLAYGTLSKRFGRSSLNFEETARNSLERAARMMAADHFLGVGVNHFVVAGNSGNYLNKANVDSSEANRSKPTHNAYLLARAETGWAGEIALIMMLLVPCLRGLTFAFQRQEPVRREISLGASIALMVNIFHNNYEYALMTYNILALVLLNIGLIAAQVRRSWIDTVKRTYKRPDRPTEIETAEPHGTKGDERWHESLT